MSRSDDAIYGMLKGDERRFFDKVDKSMFGCYRWLAGTDKDGYGTFKVYDGSEYGVSVRAHRVAYWLDNRYLPEDDRMVCHTCDHVWCVRPSHLYDCSAADNSQDIRGIKTTKERVELIYDLYLVNGLTSTEVAEEVGLSQSTVSRILRGDHPSSTVGNVSRGKN